MIIEDRDISIYKVTQSDIDDIVTIENESFQFAWKRETFENELNNEFSRFYIAKVKGIPAGFIMYWDIPYEIHLINIAVRPQFRRQGIASRMLSDMIEYARVNSKDIITLEVRVSNKVAISFYKKFGFKELFVREKYYVDNDEDAIVMELLL